MHLKLMLVPVVFSLVNEIGTLISLLLVIPPDNITVANITPDDSDPLNVDDSNVNIATIIIIIMAKIMSRMYMLLLVPSLSMIITVDDEVPSDNDEQLDNSLIAILNVSLSSCIISLMMSTLNDDDLDPAEIVTLNTSSVDMA